MDFTEILGLLAGLCIFPYLFINFTKKTYNRSSFYKKLVFSFGVVGWFVYGCLIRSFSIIFFSLSITLFYINFKILTLIKKH